jgi:predicted RNase H-like nuclease (RuvC/YqgF family)
VSSRAEGQLRGRVADLEARLADLARCLEDAEQRAAELLAVSERVRQLEAQLTEAKSESERVRLDLERRHAAITSTRSWRLTEPLRSAANRIRDLLGR